MLGEQGLVILFLLALAIVSVTIPNFMTQRNVLGLLQSVVTIGIVACTMMLCLASRDVDLSVGSTVAFTGMIAVMMSNHTENILLGLLAAIAAGLNVGATRIIIFVLQGIACAVAGILLSSRITSGQPNAALGLELSVISACVLGGVSMSGGRAAVSGVLVGVLIMGIAENVMNLMNIQPSTSTWPEA